MIEMLRQGICTAQICTDINPNDEDAYDRIDEELKQIPSGTENGWRVMRTENRDFEPIVQCANNPHRYHYLVEC